MVAASIKEADNPTMQCIFYTFVSFRTIYQQYSVISMSFLQTEEELLKDERMAFFKGTVRNTGPKYLQGFIAIGRIILAQKWVVYATLVS